jgi:CHAT domain-containing protein
MCSVRRPIRRARDVCMQISVGLSIQACTNRAYKGVSGRAETGALRIQRRVLKLSRDEYGQDHPEVARSLHQLGLIKKNSGDLDGVLVALEEALEIRRSDDATDAQSLSMTIQSVAIVHARQSRHELAIRGFRESLAILEEIFDPDHPDVATALANLGRSLVESGAKQEALPLFERAIRIDRDTLGPDHLDRAIALADYGRTLGALGRDADARAATSEALDVAMRNLERLVGATSERERLALIGQERGILDSYLSVQEDPSRTYSAVLQWKSIVSESLRSQRLGLRIDPELSSRLATVRSEIAAIAMRRIAGEIEPGQGEEIVRLTEQKDQLERELAQRDHRFALSDSLKRADLSALCDALPAGSAIIDTLRYERSAEGSNGELGTIDSYAAWVLRPEDCSPVRVELGAAADLDESISVYRNLLAASGVPRFRIDAQGIAVREQVWDPLEPALTGASQILVVPDAVLTMLPLAPLPLSDGSYLIESWPVSYLEAATDLVSAERVESAGSLVVGGVEYGSEPASSELALRDGACRAGPFTPLPGTKTEAAAVGQLLDVRMRGEVAVLTGAAASEQEVAAAMVGRRVIHLATHGFFADESCSSLGDANVVLSPMALSGVALAGSNQRAGNQDGILTAEEVASLDLRGTELVVLSACNTGLGAVLNGQSVQGLRRGFAQAGVRTVVASLWSVPDATTSVLMRSMYTHMLRRRSGMPPAEALRAAQLELLRSERDGSVGRAHAWAAFIAIGDPQ